MYLPPFEQEKTEWCNAGGLKTSNLTAGWGHGVSDQGFGGPVLCPPKKTGILP